MNKTTRTVSVGLCGNGKMSMRVEYWAEDAFGHSFMCCAMGMGCNGLPYSNCDFLETCYATHQDPFGGIWAKVVADMASVTTNAISATSWGESSEELSFILTESARVVIIDPYGTRVWYDSEGSLSAGIHTVYGFGQSLILPIALTSTGSVIGVGIEQVSVTSIDPIF